MVESNGTEISHSAGDVNVPVNGSNKAPNGVANGRTDGHTGNSGNNGNTYPAPIAICGLAMRLPGGVSDADGFWNFLMDGGDARGPIPTDRYNLEGFNDKLGSKRAIETQFGYFLDGDLGSLDSSFFSMTSAELEKADPQQRMLLEVTRECLENAGEVDYRGKAIGCYVGTFGEDWLQMGAKDSQYSGRYLTTGHCDFMMANRVSYEYDFCGPSLVLKTGCSASLVALHEACRALQSDDCSAAIVAGSNLIIGPTTTIELTQDEVLSPQGSCRTFDAAADGFARAEAVNAVYIKKLNDALQDGNPIRAVIRNTGANTDGNKANIMQPDSRGHERLMRKVYEGAGLDPCMTAFVECHGTGTAVGDPIETRAVGNVFGEGGVFIGSVKPNMGHSEGASGLTSLIKAVLAVEHEVIPPNIKFDIPNPQICFNEKKLTVPVKPTAWPADRAFRVSINSFGIGSANAHAIVDSPAEFGLYHTGEHEASESCTRLLPISANTKVSLQQNVSKTLDYVKSNPYKISDLAYTLAIRRDHLQHRAFIVVDKDNVASPSSYLKTPAKQLGITMVFSGQGAQWPKMGVELLDYDTKFLDDIRSMDRILRSLKHPPEWNIEDELRKPFQTSRLNVAELAQPVSTALQIGLVDALSRCGVRPAAVVGHSSGEIAAAYACGVLSLRAALVAAYYRGLITKGHTAISPGEAPSGAMAAIGLGAKDVSPFLSDKVVMACENSEDSITISGDRAELEKTLENIRTEKPDILVRMLKVDMAYHSFHMRHLSSEYQRLMEEEFQDENFFLGNAEVPFFSSVTTGNICKGKALGPQYWVSNLVSPVLFKSAVSNALQSQHKNILLEIGPHSTLAGPLQSISSKAELTCPYVSIMKRHVDCTKTFLSAIGELYQHGAVVDFRALTTPGKVLTDLPTYSWDHTGSTYWYELQASRDWRFRKFGHHSLLGIRLPETTDLEPCWRNALSIDDEPWLYDHKLQNDVVLPFAGYCTMAAEAFRQITGVESGYSLRHVVISNAIVLTNLKPVEIRTTLRPSSFDGPPKSWNFVISSNTDSNWVVNCEGGISPKQKTLPVSLGPKGLLRDVQLSTWYDALSSVGVNYGPHFQCLSSIKASVSDHMATGNITSPDSQLTPAFLLHPCAIDACMQLVIAALSKGLGRNINKMYVPTVIEKIDISRGASDMTAKAWSTDGGKSFGIECVADDLVVLQLTGLQVNQLDNGTDAPDIDQYAAAELEWQPHFDLVPHTTLLVPPPFSVEVRKLREEATLLCMIDCTERIKGLEAKEPFMLKFQKWMIEQVRLAEAGSYPVLEDAKNYLNLTKSDRKTLIEDTFAKISLISYEDPITRSISRVWESIETIFTGEDLALNILLEDNLLTKIYNDASFDHSRFIRLLAHTKPNLKILEVGAGTGGTTQTFLKDLVDAEGHPMYSLYTFTDISDGFFPMAKQRFSYAPNMEFKVFDISKDPFNQGFKAETYDLILAANVVHATPVLLDTLRHLRPLLSTTGHLVLTELTTTTMNVWNYAFGTLPGWWLGEADDRLDKPNVTTDRWHRELCAAGFTGVDTAVDDAEQPYLYCSALVTRPKPPAIRSEPSREITVLCDSHEGEIAGHLASALSSLGYSISFCELGQVLPLHRDIISTLGLESRFLEDISEPRFLAFQDFLRSHKSQKLLWLALPSQISCRNPLSALSIGVARKIRSELGIPCFTLEIDPADPKLADLVVKTFTKIQESEDTENLLPDSEFVVYNGMIHVGRYHPFSTEERRQGTTNAGSDQVKKLDISKLGSLQGVSWTQEAHIEQIRDDVVELEVCAVGLESALDNVPYCQEVAGVVRRIGSKVKNVAVGERVMALWPSNSIATHAVITGCLVAKIPDHLTFEEAASMPTSFVTAFRSLLEVGQLTARHSVLIHLAASSLGHAALDICKAVGAEIYATVDDEEEAHFLTDTYGIASSRIYQVKDDLYAARLIDDTQGYGTDIVLNSRRELLQSSWKCVAEFGKFIDVGSGDLTVLDRFDMQLFMANRSYCCVNLAHLIRELPTDTGRLLETCLDWQRQGKVSPVPRITSFAATEIDQDLLARQTGETKGKTIIRMPQNPASINGIFQAQKLSLDPKAAYLLAGELGGLGLSLATWLVERGARNLVVLSESAGKTIEAKQLSAEVASLGCSLISVAGKVQSMDDVERAVLMAGRPIKGVVHLAMVLRDAPILEISHPDWTAAIEPKVKGSWNLHNALTNQSLDFYLIASSLFTFSEHLGQGGYNASNAFLAAFCQYRHDLGLPASILNVCPVDGVGLFAENSQLKKKMKAQGFYFLREQAFLDIAELSLLTPRPAPLDASIGPCSFWKNSCDVSMGLRSELKLDEVKNGVSWRRDRRMAMYHNVTNFNNGEHAADSSKLRNLLSTANNDPDILTDKASGDLLAYEIGKKVLEFSLRPDEDVDISLSLVQMGMDSLKAVELRRWWKQTFGIEINIFEIMLPRALEQLGRLTADKIKSMLKGEEASDQPNGH